MVRALRSERGESQVEPEAPKEPEPEPEPAQAPSAPPQSFCCPISQELMSDPVLVVRLSPQLLSLL